MYNVEIFVDYGAGFEPDGGIEFDTVLDFSIWKSREKSESAKAIADGDYNHKRITVNNREVWSI
jgi:hypothetical protein